MKRLMVLLATGFGLGYSPVASGTVGTLWGVLIVWLTFPHLDLAWQIALAAALPLLGVPICEAAERQFGTKDDGRIVADEYLCFPLCMLGLPVASWPYMMPIAFLTARFFDIVKPPPANGLQRLRGGVGIMIDDLVASIYSLCANLAIYAVLSRLLT